MVENSEEGSEKVNVYIIREEDVEDGPVKIGTAVKVKRRIKDIQAGNHRKLQVIGIFPNVSRNLEYTLHNYFQDKRIRNEWYESSVLQEIGELFEAFLCTTLMGNNDEQ